MERLIGHGARRVAVLDIDSHHGNGTQGIFWSRGDVLFTSVHGDPAGYYPWYVGHADELGGGPGLGCNRNFPLAAGTGDLGWLAALDAALRAIERFGADALVVSLGFDASRDEPLNFLSRLADGFARAGAAIGRLALPAAFIQEGGYNTATLGRLLQAFLDRLPRMSLARDPVLRLRRDRGGAGRGAGAGVAAGCPPSWWSACRTRRWARRGSGCGRR